jgi:hypothetical protein
MSRLRTAIGASCLLMLFAATHAGAADVPPIASSFDTFWRAAQGRPLVEQMKSWDRDIETPRRDVYASVVWESQDHPDWAATKQRLLYARFAMYPQIATGVAGEISALQSTIATQVPRFRQLFPDASSNPPVRVLLAPNFDAKSGVLADGTPVLAFAADSLLLENADLNIVVPHELFHLYHAQHAGIRNDGVMPGVPLTIPLFEEGLATYVSGELSPGHKDGELLLQSDLGGISETRLPEIAQRFLVDARDNAIDPEHPGSYKKWFNAAATPYQADLPNRSGYWLGLQLVRHLRKTYSLAEIASWTPAQADTKVMSALRQLSQAH